MVQEKIISYLFNLQSNKEEYSIFEKLPLKEQIISLIIGTKGYDLSSSAPNPFYNCNLGRIYTAAECEVSKNIKNLGFVIGFNKKDQYFIAFSIFIELVDFESRLFKNAVKDFYDGFNLVKIIFHDDWSPGIIRYFTLDELINWFGENIKDF